MPRRIPCSHTKLLEELSKGKFAGVPAALRHDINEHYAGASARRRPDKQSRKEEAKAARLLAAFNASFPAAR